MQIIIKATNIELTEEIKKMVNEQIGSLEGFLDILENPDFEAFMEVGKVNAHHQKGDVFRAECQIKLPGKGIRSEAVRDSLQLAIVEVKDELQRQIKRYKQTRPGGF